MSVGETFGNVVSGKGKGLSRDGVSARLGNPAGSGRAVLWAAVGSGCTLAVSRQCWGAHAC